MDLSDKEKSKNFVTLYFLILTKYLRGNIFLILTKLLTKIFRIIFWAATNSTIPTLKNGVNKSQKFLFKFLFRIAPKNCELSVKEKSIKIVTLYYSNINKNVLQKKNKKQINFSTSHEFNNSYVERWSK